LLQQNGAPLRSASGRRGSDGIEVLQGGTNIPSVVGQLLFPQPQVVVDASGYGWVLHD